jgi:hypothetical protein
VETRLEVVLVTGERRTLALPSHSGSVANALERLEPWIRTTDGGWVQKRFIVEVRTLDPATSARANDEESRPLRRAVDALADQAREE